MCAGCVVRTVTSAQHGYGFEFFILSVENRLSVLYRMSKNQLYNFTAARSKICSYKPVSVFFVQAKYQSLFSPYKATSIIYLHRSVAPLISVRLFSESAYDCKDGTQMCTTWQSFSHVNKVCLFTVCNSTVCKINLLAGKKKINNAEQSVNSHRWTALPASRPCPFSSTNLCLTAFLKTSHQSPCYGAP